MWWWGKVFRPGLVTVPALVVTLPYLRWHTILSSLTWDLAFREGRVWSGITLVLLDHAVLCALVELVALDAASEPKDFQPGLVEAWLDSMGPDMVALVFSAPHAFKF